MGKKKDIKFLTLIAIFLCTSVIVHNLEQPGASRGKPPLKQYLQEVTGYTTLRSIDLAKDAFDMLNLDDYLFSDFKGPDGEVNLYIGYYYSSAKAYASHSPLVCYPSQGWQIDRQPTKGRLDVNGHSIRYEEIVTSLGGHKELVLYWYQARLQTNNQVYRNKIDLGYNKLRFNDEQHGFVRVAVSFSERSYDEAKVAALGFIQAFYTPFTDYIVGEKRVEE